jgi:DNA topoisomerase III
MVGAIDAVCDVAQRIIGKLKDGAQTGGAPLLGSGFGGAAGDHPPTPAMKRFAVTISRQKRVKLPAGYATSGSICRTFLQQHAPKKSGDVTVGEQAQSPRMSAGVESNQSARPIKPRAKPGSKSPRLTVESSTTPVKRTRKPKVASSPAADAQATPLQKTAAANTPLRIPYGNKEAAQKLGARYAAGGWYAPPGVDLVAFSAQGWL